MELEDCTGRAAGLLRKCMEDRPGMRRHVYEAPLEALAIELEELRRKVALQDDQIALLKIALLKARMHRAELVTSMHTPMR